MCSHKELFLEIERERERGRVRMRVRRGPIGVNCYHKGGMKRAHCLSELGKEEGKLKGEEGGNVRNERSTRQRDDEVR